MSKKPKPGSQDADPLLSMLDRFDFRVDCDDFLLYELGRFIEEDRASLEDSEFRRVIDEGIYEHVDTRLQLRAKIARQIRVSLPHLKGSARPLAARVLRATEDTQFLLRDAPIIVRSYTGYMFGRLEECADADPEPEKDARAWIERWRRGDVLREETMNHLKAIGHPAVGPLADLLFESLEDREAVNSAIEVLGSIRSAAGARVLAHAVSEPMLDEDLEVKAFGLLRALWPLPRFYVLYSLRPHDHEDLPFRWFQLLVDCDEPLAVDRILEEVLVHAAEPQYQQDLLALLELVRLSRDPDAERKIVETINASDIPRPAAGMLEQFLKTYTPTAASEKNRGIWEQADRQRAANKKYLAAARLLGTGKKAEALRKLDELLQEQPQYPFALMLKELILNELS